MLHFIHEEKIILLIVPKCNGHLTECSALSATCEVLTSPHGARFKDDSICLFFFLFFSPVSPKCIHNGKEFSEGEVYRMDPCWLCQCRGGISFCSKAECAELDCENFYIPEGECCPVCIGTHIYLAFNFILDFAKHYAIELGRLCFQTFVFGGLSHQWCGRERTASWQGRKLTLGRWRWYQNLSLTSSDPILMASIF